MFEYRASVHFSRDSTFHANGLQICVAEPNCYTNQIASELLNKSLYLFENKSEVFI